MPRLRVLSGMELIRILGRFGFLPESQRGDHVKLRRYLPTGVRQNVTVPVHNELDRGTLLAIYRQCLRFIPEAELHRYFYNA
jgi:predicted RNA binding protein YcfA (HicA-like mRNA interferase family)